MNLSNLLRKAVLMLPFLGVVLVAYPTARWSASDVPRAGAQIVAQGTGRDGCAPRHGFEGAADGRGAFPRMARQSPEHLAEQLRLCGSPELKNALLVPRTDSVWHMARDRFTELTSDQLETEYPDATLGRVRSPAKGMSLNTAIVTLGTLVLLTVLAFLELHIRHLEAFSSVVERPQRLTVGPFPEG